MAGLPEEEDRGDLAKVAHAYGVAEAALVLSRLRAAGFLVVPDTWNTVSTAWNWTHALGGIAFAVPASQAEAAESLLEEFRPAMPRPGLLGIAVCLLGFLIAGLPPPGLGLFTMRPAAAATSRN